MARDVNFVSIIGRLVRNPEIRYTTAGTPVVKFSIANNQSYIKNGVRENYVNYIDISVWGNQALNCEKYLKKGSQVAIIGVLKQNRWEDKSTGQIRSKVEVTATTVQFLTTSEGKTINEPKGNYSNPEGSNVSIIGRPKGKDEQLEFSDPWENQDPDDDLDLGFKDDDIPF